MQSLFLHDARAGQLLPEVRAERGPAERRAVGRLRGRPQHAGRVEVGGRRGAAAVEEGVPLKTALAKVIRATGVKEFAETVGMPSPNVLRAIHPRHNPTQETLERLLKPFGLRIGLAQITQRRKRRAA